VEYVLKGNVIYDELGKIAEVRREEQFRTDKIEIVGNAFKISLEREGIGFRILKDGSQVGTERRGLTVRYQATTYRVSRGQLTKFVRGSSNELRVDGDPWFFVIRREGEELKALGNANPDVMMIYLALLIPYLKPVRVVSKSVPREYSISSSILSALALASLTIPAFTRSQEASLIAYVIFLISAILSVVVRRVGRRRTRESLASR